MTNNEVPIGKLYNALSAVLDIYSTHRFLDAVESDKEILRKKIFMIKELRSITGLGLKEAKDVIDDLVSYSWYPVEFPEAGANGEWKKVQEPVWTPEHKEQWTKNLETAMDAQAELEWLETAPKSLTNSFYLLTLKSNAEATLGAAHEDNDRLLVIMLNNFS